MNYIGIKNKYKIYQLLLSAAFVIFIVLTVMFWLLYYGDCANGKFLDYGVEVEAEIIEERETYVSDDDGYAQKVTYFVYRYVSPEGKEYSGTTRNANLSVGKKITIIIDPNGTESTDSSREYLASLNNSAHVDFTLACIFSGLLCISSYLFFYRVVYRKVVDKKLNKNISSYTGEKKSEGEVVKVVGLLWFYVKVSFRDDAGIVHEKWAREWFSRREAKFLAQKHYVNIVIYKNIYGIAEEMPITKKCKSKNRDNI